MSFPWIIGLSIGVAVIAAGALARAGRYRYWARWYREQQWPLLMRNAAFAWMPLGLALMLLSVGFDTGFNSDAGLVVMGVGLGFVAFSMAVILHPPHWLKPRWLVEEELIRRAEPRRRGPGELIDRTIIGLLCLSAIGIGAILIAIAVS